MKLLINISNIKKGGGIQVALSFLEALKRIELNYYYVFLSPEIEHQIDLSSYSNRFIFYIFPVSPSSIQHGWKIRKRLFLLEDNIKPDIVFTVFGPAYWTPKNYHISGFADGWCYTPNSLAFKKLTFLERLKLLVMIMYKNYNIKKADHIIVETELAKSNIVKNLNVNEEDISVVGNTFHQVYNKYIPKKKHRNIFSVLVLCAYYKNKNLDILNKVAEILLRKGIKDIEICLTLPSDIFTVKFGKNDIIKNYGVTPIHQCPELYNKSDILLLPTLLETFTATYPEAMKMETPILTSNLNFAVDLCGDAALYFNPLDPNDIVDKILTIRNDTKLYERLVEKGKERVKTFETSESRAVAYLELFDNFKAYIK